MINLIQPLPFYDRISEQTMFKENCNGVFKFLCPGTNLIPFLISVPFGSVSIDAMKIAGYTCSYDIDVTFVNSAKVKFVANATQKWVMFKGDQLTFVKENGAQSPLELSAGYYWYEVTVDGVKKFSEMFYVNGDGVCDKPITMEIQAWHDKDINGYTFVDGFKFKAFFNSFITNITPDITDEFTKDGYERNILLRRVTQFTHNIELDPTANSISIGIAAMTGLRNIVIKENGNEYQVKDITYKQDVEDGGSLDTIQLAFTIFDQDMITTNC